jgi:hypothetical protein
MRQIIADSVVVPGDTRRTALQRTVCSEPVRAIVFILRPALAPVGRAQTVAVAAAAMPARKHDVMVHVGRKREEEQEEQHFFWEAGVGGEGGGGMGSEMDLVVGLSFAGGTYITSARGWTR